MGNKVEYHEEQIVEANGIQICYDAFGNPNDPALLLIMGLGMQLIGWQEEFCKRLAKRGYWVIRFDNRDSGRSTHFTEAGVPGLWQYIGKLVLKRSVATPYSLEDMAGDAVGLLDALDVEQAHIVGASMGGMIGQLLALNYPERVLSLTSIMSTTNEDDLPRPSLAVTRIMLTPPPTEYDAYIENTLSVYSQLSGSQYPIEPDNLRQLAEAVWQRGRNPAGTARQLAAVVETPGRRARLRSLNVPTLVIHGDEDPLVPYAAGVDTAEAIPNARLLTLRGFGHNMPSTSWDEIIDAICEHAEDAEQHTVGERVPG